MINSNSPQRTGASTWSVRSQGETEFADDSHPMSSSGHPPLRQSAAPAPPLAGLVSWFEGEDEDEYKDADEFCRDFAFVLRDSLDELIDGHRTDRWHYEQLRKVEKKALGEKVLVNLTHEYSIPDGDELHWKINGLEFDCVFSLDFGGWEISMHMYVCDDHGEQSGTADHHVLLVWMSDDDSQWAAGIVQVRDDLLSFGVDDSGHPCRQYTWGNRRHLNERGIDSVHWLWGGMQTLPPNPFPRPSQGQLFWT